VTAPLKAGFLESLVAALWTLALTVSVGAAVTGAFAPADALEQQGKFREAAAVLERALADSGLTSAQRANLEFERDRLERIRLDYSLTREQLLTALSRSLEGLTPQEFDRWEAEGRFDSRLIDGERRYLSPSVSNLYFRHPELEARRKTPKPTADYERAVRDTCRAIREAARAQGQPYVLPKRFRATMNVVAASNATPAGQLIRAWLPIPREFPYQAGFKLLECSSRPLSIAAPDDPIRSICLEQTAREGLPTRFSITYEYTAHGVRFEMPPASFRPSDAKDAALASFLREAPHVEFTPQMRALADRVVGGEKNPYWKARRAYDWISTNILYSFAPEYSTIRNLGEFCRSRGYGDCGQEGMLFITLCRLGGIPARWQSGWFTFPGGKTIHDWVEIHLQPYGWMPVDPYMGIWAMRYARTLSDAERREIREFYFGGLDSWRMIANSDHGRDLTPRKRALRSDTVDFQRGEMEWGDHNIYLNQFDYSLEVVELGVAP
jgi:transglutaminase-like putative cysteine protease